MINNDLIQRFLFENHAVRGQWVRLTNSYQTIGEQHRYPLLLKKLLGETLMAATMLSGILKFKGRLMVQFQGTSDLKLLLAQCNHDFHLRGLVQWEGDIDEEKLPALLKQGLIVITIDPEQGGNRYQGMVAWQGNSIAQSIEGYFKSSEQLPTRLWITVNETSVTGLLLQQMPNETTNNSWEHLQHLTDTITSQELATLSMADLLKRLYSEEEIRIFQAEPVAFRCNCSIERSENALLILGREEVEQELKEKQQVVVTCEFCNKEYIFGRQDITRIFNKDGNAPTSTQVQ